MSLVVVTGLGPRTGTSFVMNQARLKGLPIKGQAFIDGLTIPQHNPDGYWESTSNDLTDVINHELFPLKTKSILFDPDNKKKEIR
jgi:hypothetical protein